MRVLAIGLAVAALLLPFLPSLWYRLSGETGNTGMAWLVLTVFAMFIALKLSLVAVGIGREAYLDLREPRPLSRRIELALLALPGALCVALPTAALVYLFAS